MGRRSDLEPDPEELTLACLRLTGRIETAWEAGHITKSTFYRWLDKREGFHQKVKDALLFWAKTQEEYLVPMAKKWVLDVLTHGYTITTITEQAFVSEDGQESGNFRKVTTVVKPPPDWLLQLAFQVAGPAAPELPQANAPIAIQFVELKSARADD